MNFRRTNGSDRNAELIRNAELLKDLVDTFFILDHYVVMPDRVDMNDYVDHNALNRVLNFVRREENMGHYPGYYIECKILLILYGRRVREWAYHRAHPENTGYVEMFTEEEQRELIQHINALNTRFPNSMAIPHVMPRDYQAFPNIPERRLLDRWYVPNIRFLMDLGLIRPDQNPDEMFLVRLIMAPWHSPEIIPMNGTESIRLYQESPERVAEIRRRLPDGWENQERRLEEMRRRHMPWENTMGRNEREQRALQTLLGIPANRDHDIASAMQNLTIQRIPFVASGRVNTDESIECPICLDSVDEYVRPDCNHPVCVPCMNTHDVTSLSQGRSLRCGLCREEITRPFGPQM